MEKLSANIEEIRRGDSLMNLKVLMVSFSRGRPFIEDTAYQLVQKDFTVWHFIISTQTFVNYNTGESKQITNGIPFKPLKYIQCFRTVLKKALQEDFDIIHFHPAYWLFTFLMFFVDKKKIKVMGTIWGSDYYQASNWKKKLQSFFYKQADFITFTNPKTGSSFLETYPELKPKTKTLRFGLSKLDLIGKLKSSESVEEMKQSLDFPLDKKVVCIGYNASPNQNHLEILDSIQKNQNDLPDDILLLLPISYGGSKDYVNSIKEKLGEIKFPHILIEEFVTDEDVCRLRIISDIFIQVQSSDQFSGAMQEALFAGVQVITGSWLPYDLFIQKGIQFNLVDNISEIATAIHNNIFTTDKNINSNSEIIYDLSGMESVMTEWRETYKSLAI